MSEDPQLSTTGFKGQRLFEMEAFEVFLDLMPNASILVDSQTRRLLSANSKAAELTLYTQAELSELDMLALLPDWELDSAEDFEALPPDVESATYPEWQRTKTLVKQDQSLTSVQVSTISLGAQDRRVLILLEPLEPPAVSPGLTPPEKIWDGLDVLSSAVQESDFESAINNALLAGSIMTGAKTIAVYLAHNQEPIFQRFRGIGKFESLPGSLSPRDMSALNKPKLWLTGEKPALPLYRAARIANLSYLASAPLGQSNALNGLVILADEQTGPNALLLEIVEILGISITSIFQTHSRIMNIGSKLRTAQSQLTVSKELERRIQESALILNPDLVIERINQPAEMILGYPNNEVHSQPANNILIGSESLSSALIAARDGSATYDLDNIHLYRRNGESFPAIARVFPVKKDNRVNRIIVILHDLSEQEQIRTHTQQLEQRAFLGELTAIFAHEIRNPINNISTGLQLMAMNLPQADPNQDTITRMLQDCDRLETLIKSILAYSHSKDYEMEKLDLPLLLQRLLERLRPRIAKNNVESNLTVEGECPPIRGNMRALEQVFSNLITNSLQAMSAQGGSLVLKVHSKQSHEGQNYLEVSVADTGPGIPKEVQERIFQPFFTTERDGTGLGLAIAKQIITAHKGNIRLKSFPGGTVFFVQIPVAK